MEFSAQMIAGLVGGTIVGNPEATVSDFAKIEEGRPGCISFLANDKYEHYIYTTESSIVLVNDTFEPKHDIKATLIKVANAREAVANLINIYDSMKPKPKGIDSSAYIDPTATIGKDVYLGPFVAIGPKAVIGDGCILHPHATVGARATIGNNTEMYAGSVVYHDCKVGARCILHANSVIGADGFGFEPTEEGYKKIAQIGIAVLEDDVEIGANACVDKSQMGSTIIRKGCKIDNQCAVAHNVEVGANTVMAAQTGIAGSTKIGEHCIINTCAIVEHDDIIENYVHISPRAAVGGTVNIGESTHIGIGAVVKNNIDICSNCTIGAGAVVVKNIENSGIYIGVPARKA